MLVTTKKAHPMVTYTQGYFAVNKGEVFMISTNKKNNCKRNE